MVELYLDWGDNYDIDFGNDFGVVTITDND
jgi:hypothetical protein